MSTIPIGRILEKLDQYLNCEDYLAAEKHLDYWLAEAEMLGDDRGSFNLLNEQIGLFRKTVQEEKASIAIQKALALASYLKLDNSVSGATAFLNAATAYKSFGHWEKALPLYEAAQTIYERDLAPDDRRLGGLYNNMALALVDAGKFDEAFQCFLSAVQVMEQVDQGGPECAITWLNIADLKGRTGCTDSEIASCLDRAEELLNSPTVCKDAYFGYVAEKCAPAFEYYGYFAFAEELRVISKRIREGEIK